MIGLLLLFPAALAAAPTSTLRPVSEVEWTALNPARGDASPRAATLWGDRAGPGPSGFLVTFADGFSSPPHIHNVTYRAVVLEGEVHNDDAGARPMWMAPGSFWTQPQAEAHITSSRGVSVAYVEIDDGPYLVHPAEQARDVPEKPVNLDASNLVWVASTVAGVEVSRLWGAPDLAAGGVMVRLRPGAVAKLSAEADLRAVVVTGTPTVQLEGTSATAAPGSLISGTSHSLTCTDPSSLCALYVRAERGFSLSEAPSVTP
jgi:quercetin dioxygenase-like cupin family protein